MLSHECREKHMKQMKLKPTERRLPISNLGPGPGQYEPPEIIGGKGYSKIKRAPAYSFGLRTPFIVKPVVTARAPVLDISGMSKKGRHRITHGVVSPFLQDPPYRFKAPGPKYFPPLFTQIKRPPAYSIRKAPKPPQESETMWTPPPNMYCPPIDAQKKRFPAFSFGKGASITSTEMKPGPGEYDPNYRAAIKDMPKYSMGLKFQTPSVRTAATPAPNEYCEKRFNYPRPWVPTPSFGIKHSPYASITKAYLLTSPRGDII